MSRKLQPWQIGIAVCMVYFMADLSNIISPALAGLSGIYTDRSILEISELATANRLLAIGGCILAGLVAGKRVGGFYVSYRLVILVSFLTQIIGGVLPMLAMDNYTLVYWARMLFGFGNGIMGGIAAAMIIRCFEEGPLRDKWLGMGGFFQGFGGVIVPLMAGYVVAIDITYVWPLHLVAVICLVIFIFWWEEPKELSKEALAALEVQDSAEETRPKKLTIGTWLCILTFGVEVVAVQQVLINASYVIDFNGLGTAVEAGWLMTWYFAGTSIGSLLFAQYARITGRWAIPIGLIGSGICELVAFFATGMLVMNVAVFFLGWFCTGWFLPAAFAYIGKKQAPSSVARASAFFQAGGNLGGYLTPYATVIIMTIFATENYQFAFAGGAAIYVAIGLVWVAFMIATEKKEDWLPQAEPEKAPALKE